MFLHRLENSLCQAETLAPGAYLGVRRFYLCESTSTKVIYIEWHLDDSQIVCAAEFWTVEKDGAIKGMDFKQMVDGSWIDGDGLRANSLVELLPIDELGASAQISEEIVGPEFVGAI